MPRFRDLVTPLGGSIAQHQAIAEAHGGVWWSWWKRQTEICPETLFDELIQSIKERDGAPIPAFAFDSGTEKIYRTDLQTLAVAPEGSAIGTPKPQLTPRFCHNGEYSAWFFFGPLREVTLQQVSLAHDSFPTNPELASTHADLVAAPITSVKELRLLDTTLYVVRFFD